MVRRVLCLSFVMTLLVVCQVAHAQAQQPLSPTDQSAPAHIAFVEGVAALERDGHTDDAPGNMPLLAGDRVRTRAGRVEILFADGSTLHLDRDSTIDLQSDELVRLVAGRLRLSIPGPSRTVAYRIDAPHGWLQIAEPGEYRAALIQSANQSELEAAVLRGRAELINEDGRTALRAGERAFARASAAPSFAYVFNSASGDAFDRWSEERRSDRLGLSTQYLPDEVRPYAGTLDRHGSWRYESSYGYVWYPRVDDGWRPYYQGRWATLPSYGWTWIGSDAWAWPTHHYGRWGLSGAAWFWIPGRTWGPAWVSWGSAPGYVSWCPLGWNNRPVVQIVNINIHRGYDPWRAWTVVPQRHFGVDYVHRRVVSGRQFDSRTRGAFSHRDSAPRIVGTAVPRSSTPIRVAGTGNSRRSTVPLLTNRGESAAGRFTPSAPNRPDRDESRRGQPATEDRTGVRPLSSRERTVPDRPLVRSPRDSDRPSAGEPYARDRDARYERPAQPGARSERPVAPVVRDQRPAQLDPRRESPAVQPEAYRPRDGYRAGSSYEAGDRRAAPRDGAPRPSDSAPRVAPRVPDRAPQPSYERRGPSSQRPAPSSAGPPRPERSGPPPSATPPPGSRPRGGDAPSSGAAKRRPGGGG